MENLKIEGFIWIESSEGLKIGKGRALLLEYIEKSGSIAEAARQIKIPYRKAWNMIKEMNKNNSEALVIKTIGGKNGGSSELTKEGKRLLLEYKRLSNKFIQFKKEQI